jgi:ring-1,2-phenylacetyl-CoA epoxidase subunit PaaD
VPGVSQIQAVLGTIDDPEMPISIVDLGIVEDVAIEGQRVSVTIVPTFVGCPALDMIRREIVEKVGRLEGVHDVEVHFVHDPPWTVDRISPRGRESLRAHGVVVPPHGAAPPAATVTLQTSAIACPFCGSTQTSLESPFGPTRCRQILYCRSCGNPFEGLKRLDRV